MKASYAWLRELVGASSFPSPEAVAERLTAAGLEVEGIHAYGEASGDVLVANVVSVRPHPASKHLRLVTVDAGKGSQEIVCGAPNVPEPGAAMVVLAPLGVHLPSAGLTIAPRAIAGVTSEGMLCSEKELGLGDASSGILLLPPNLAPPGTRLSVAVPAARDTVFEIGLTPNRPDGLGHRGLAREIAALLGLDGWEAPPIAPPKALSLETTESAIRVTIDAPDRCPHYGAVAVFGVRIGPSPLAVRYRLAALGVRAISNVVDVTNLVMLEFGHPLHAFDLDKVKGAAIGVRLARDGEALTTLDGVGRTLHPDDLVITDAGGPTALAGIMGGADSEISEATTRVLFECAYFDPRTVRRTARRHGIHTESSHRFERGVDAGDTRLALASALSWASAFAGGTAAKDLVFVEAKKLDAVRTRLRAGRLASLLGTPVPLEEAAGILTRLGFRVDGVDEAELQITVPTHRPDVTREADLIDEIARVRGLDAIPTVLPRIRPVRENPNVRETVLARAREVGAQIGLSEALLYGFTSEAELAKAFAPAPFVKLRNPLSEHHAVMRTSLAPGLLDAAARAARHGEHDLRLFAVGALFLAPQGAPDGRASDGLPEERLAFAALLAGSRAAWLGKPEPVDPWDAKGVALAFVSRFSGRDAELSAAALPHLHPRASAELVTAGVTVGRFGQIHPDVAEAFDVKAGAFLVEIDLEALVALGGEPPRYKAIPRLPASSRDLAVVVDAQLRAGDVEAAIRDAGAPLAEGVTLFDRYAGKGIPDGRVSLGFRVVYRALDRTLTDAEVDVCHRGVVERVEARFGAELR